MLHRPLTLLAMLLAALAMALTACGAEGVPAVSEGETVEVEEGEPIDIGELSYNVLFTRFLNAEQTEDEAFLVGQPEAKPGELYLGVFVQIENDSDEDLPSLDEDAYHVVDTEEEEYEPIESESEFALEFGAEVPAESELPLPDSPAQEGPIEGALMLFLVDDSVTENRPLKLEIESPEGLGEIILDI